MSQILDHLTCQGKRPWQGREFNHEIINGVIFECDNGDKKWRIKRDLLAKNPRVILSACSRIVVVDSKGLAFCGY